MNEWPKINHRIAFPYFHGMPENGDQFKLMLIIFQYHQSICRIQVSHTQMQKNPRNWYKFRKIFKIPISINLDLFKRYDFETIRDKKVLWDT